MLWKSLRGTKSPGGGGGGGGSACEGLLLATDASLVIIARGALSFSIVFNCLNRRCALNRSSVMSRSVANFPVPRNKHYAGSYRYDWITS